MTKEYYHEVDGQKALEAYPVGLLKVGRPYKELEAIFQLQNLIVRHVYDIPQVCYTFLPVETEDYIGRQYAQAKVEATHPSLMKRAPASGSLHEMAYLLYGIGLWGDHGRRLSDDVYMTAAWLRSQVEENVSGIVGEKALAMARYYAWMVWSNLMRDGESISPPPLIVAKGLLLDPFSVMALQLHRDGLKDLTSEKLRDMLFFHQPAVDYIFRILRIRPIPNPYEQPTPIYLMPHMGWSNKVDFEELLEQGVVPYNAVAAGRSEQLVPHWCALMESLKALPMRPNMGYLTYETNFCKGFDLLTCNHVNIFVPHECRWGSADEQQTEREDGGAQ